MGFDHQAECAAQYTDDSIVNTSFAERPLRSLLPESAFIPETDGGRQFKIRAADDHGGRSAASVLLGRMYATRGYACTPLPQHPLTERLTLIATEDTETIGTITVGFDSPKRLLVDELFLEETDALRSAGHRLCEFTKLAMDSVVRSKRVLASLFHVAYIYSHRVMGLDSLLIEVNPRHVLYYERMLGFRTIGATRHNPRVNAAAVLLCLDLALAEQQIERFGGRPDSSAEERSLYPYFFSASEEKGIVNRLKQSRQTSLQASSVDRRRAVYAH